MNVLQWLAIIILALLPIITWSYLLLGRTNENRQLLLKVFTYGGLATVPLLLYRWSWNLFPSFNITTTLSNLADGKTVNIGSFLVIPLSYILVFLTIGIFEEYLKSLVIRKKVPHIEINSVADAVEFSLVAGLGFAFVENVFYLGEIYYLVGSSALIKIFISRALFATFAHMLFSAVFGYYYGISMFASKALEKNRCAFDVQIIRKIVEYIPSLNKIKLFQFEEILLGLIYAASLHAIYNIFLELQITVFLIPFLVFGVILLVKLLKLEQKTVE
ncbi:hypothetical protein COV81_01040 [Candidatus Peregrinibacteria bacterium CG11_big_fil_rev_8_21_14_0_20_41_10]|nr:MAG: hypothetical protein COV81_01040 [Candidatus Peregrinibacteria bacterium CG11_big_fil_rev_8_21_14_0_20_41_10]PIZ74586.1 MAG: hypothetical protein COY06_03945 [Candidatus Peregrinibacteria bacterium CG_4_10_14_0_2_um_filter_41_8]PJC38128.1 MAG: hypothetical protein CO045_01975 [Candidatus Peregrinibacteria bacterium CG_4_9_14_0_2_um_filter_41_14]